MESLLLNSPYKPSQPDLEQKYFVNSYKVEETNVLHGKVWEIYQYEFSTVTSNTITVLPDGLIELVFNFKQSQVNAYLMLASTESSSIEVDHSESGFGVRFVPGWLGQIQNPPLSSSRRTLNGLTYINSAEVISNFDFLFQQIISTDSFDRRVEYCKAFFGGIERVENYQSELARQACLYLINHNGKKTISDLERYMGYSSRYIRKLFSQFVGYSPKTMNEIIKFQDSFHHFSTEPNRSLSDLACEFGYYDISHMNRAYIKLAKQLPKSLYHNLYAERKL
ncbi:helix-turn-helix domain-containing protein [Paenibacillus pabuli]|uniref:helix-turn-helix domain-containing protein n=1 Tax=Paenibacillus pabuli TaxID=1472 RepID=UPI00345AEBFC